MEYLGIPTSVLKSDDYKSLTQSEKILMISLYCEFSDCRRFTIDLEREKDSMVRQRIRNLVKSGFLIIDDMARAKRGSGRRIFQFVYPAVEFEAA